MAGPSDQDKLAEDWGLDAVGDLALSDESEESKAAAAAAEWAAMLEGGDTSGEDGGDRVLNQDEIDSLLGFDASVGSNVELTGVQALINSALVSYERLPMLEIQPRMAKVVDAFQVYLRELRKSDLEGSAGVYRLKEELLRRVNVAIYPSRVESVLFKEILVQ